VVECGDGARIKFLKKWKKTQLLKYSDDKNELKCVIVQTKKTPM